MKILHIIPSLRKGGAERICLDMCVALANAGHQVALVALRNIVEYDTTGLPFQFTVIPASVQLSVSGKTQYHTAQLEAFIKSFSPGIIHSHLFEAEIVSRSITHTGAKYFSHCHDNMHQFAAFKLNTLLNKKAFTEYYERSYLFKRYRANGGNHFIAISADTLNYFNAVLPADLKNITLLHNAINTAAFTRPVNYIPQQQPGINLVMVGSLVDKKNQAFLIDVVKQLKNKNAPACLHLLGDGPNRKRLVEKTLAYKLEKSITFYGNVSNVQQFLWNSDIYVHAATYEPFGLVLVEAMAAGLPVIALDGKGNRDLVLNGENGYMLHQANPTAFADKIIELYNNKALYRQLSANAVAFAQGFDIKTYATKLLALYQQALG